MNQQYLKRLQERADKLLQISSEEDNDLEHIQKNQSNKDRTQIKFKLVNFDQVKTDQLQKQLAQYKYTDIQLLKKCIWLTTQNNRLKIQLQKEKQKNQFILNQIKDYKVQLKDSKKTIQNLQKTYRQQLNSIRKLQAKQLNFNRKLQVKEDKKHYQQQKFKITYNRQGSSLKFQNVDQNQRYQIVCIQRQLEQYKLKNQKLTIKLQNFKRQSNSLKKGFLIQKEKIKRMSNFINLQIPKMRDLVDGLTSKVDFKLEKVLMKNLEGKHH